MSDEELQGLIGQLRDFRLRHGASDRIAAAGREAVPALLDALERETLEGAKWAMLNCLGELGSPQAVPALAACLADSDFRTVAHDALVKIAGRDLGPLPKDWLRWARQFAVGAEQHGAAETGEMSNRELVEVAVRESAASCREEEPGRFIVSLPVSGAQTQQVAIVFGQTDHEGAPIVIIFADCGEAQPEHYERALRRNLRMPYGAIALRDVGGKPYFVMFNTILRHALSPIELRKSIFAIGERAARIHRQIRE